LARTGEPGLPPWIVEGAGSRIAVLGADGFIGSWVVRAALAAGAEVRALAVKEPWRLPAAAPGLSIARIPDGRWWEAAGEVETALDGADALALLAYAPPPDRAPDAWFEHEMSVNTAGAETVAGAAARAGARVVFASSADVYGSWRDGTLADDDEPAPVTPYSRAKLEAERLVGSADRSNLSLRIGTVYGPGENGPRAIPAFIRAHLAGGPAVIHGEGTDVKDYVHVADVAGAFVNACLGGAAEWPTANVGSGRGRTTLEVLEAVREAAGADLPVEHGESTRAPSRIVLGTARAEGSLGFSARADFVAALAEEIAWIDAHTTNAQG
jgi:nucleoside-diphosphate-sugar epimerase